ncbi:Succinate-semialdehyde dehydrogenase (NADP+) [Bacillus pseudomycoides DSM 12442]|nr:Succinate-semialdehyde dehydrogenase (NADP+) [Bacillus pseudomycoides DSM 12442]
MGSFMIKDIICGVKESGTGREGIKYAIEEMTEMKLIFIKK